MQVNDNVTVRLKGNAVEDTYNIRSYDTVPDPDHGGGGMQCADCKE
jgi:hypothetical protein